MKLYCDDDAVVVGAVGVVDQDQDKAHRPSQAQLEQNTSKGFRKRLVMAFLSLRLFQSWSQRFVFNSRKAE